MNTNRLIFMAVMLALSACGSDNQGSAGEQVSTIANEFLDAFYAYHPAEAAESGYPDAPMDRFGDHSTENRTAFDHRVDGWIAELAAISLDEIEGTPAAITWVFSNERLRALADMRVCRMSEWNISPTWTGWQSLLISALAVQPVESEQQRADALARAADIPRYIQTEIANLRRGLDAAYLAPQSGVDAVIGQFESLLDTTANASPFFSPAARSDDAEFVAAYRVLYDEQLQPALQRYLDFLRNEYQGREVIGVGANPDGAACYAASVRYWSSLPMTPEDIHQAGLREMARIQSEMLDIAREHFGTDDLKALFQRMRTEPEFTFASEQAMLDYVNAAVARAETAMDDWFENVPESKLIVYPSPAYEKDSGGGFYSSSSGDEDVLTGYYKVGTYNPTGISIAGTESTAFHESWPGHHLDSTITRSNPSLHPIQKYMWISGTSEGWALYSERLADEIGLYSSQVARLGMLSNEAFRAARLVVDPGLHVMGWTREQAIAYMLENTAEGYDSVAGQIDRYAAVPGQATSYLIGSLEIQRLRRKAEAALGDRFDIKAFHKRILMNGAVTLPMLGASVDAWIEETQ